MNKYEEDLNTLLKLSNTLHDETSISTVDNLQKEQGLSNNNRQYGGGGRGGLLQGINNPVAVEYRRTHIISLPINNLTRDLQPFVNPIANPTLRECTKIKLESEID